MSAPTMTLDDLRVDADHLYREEVITDLRAATLRRLVPLTADGQDDPTRPVLFTAQTSVYTQMGMIPLNAELQAKDVKSAVVEFPGAIKKAMDQLMNEAREIQRQEASRIVVPDSHTASRIQLS
ncbi:hypothetical protein FACS1894139_13790 [Planctomycetales bacterium]|nr:hypothetical protein FACS1894107_06750 [Planctomycetales bacterium]GHS98622.1 hypothetical protein FACS1894108_07110 [Planctomycetales bacterium]GHT06878.1 hypothetical protein FACS1894139_13790 [Planctomycetales bacterium]GHV20051.1 hypothetical protein AGMMS49959_06520 [Planctomycetales bacterium]